MEYLVEDIEVLKDIVYLKLSNNEKYKIHAVAFANYYINKGKFIDDNFLSKLIDESKYYFIKDQVIKKLQTKDYSKSEIIEYLSDKLDEYEIDRLIKDLEKNNYLNDYNYLKRIFNNAYSKLKGKLYIFEQLKNKNIDEQLINIFFDNYDEKKVANKLINNELKKLKDRYSKVSIINKIAYKLNYNGFSEELIQDEISNLEYLNIKTNDDIIIKDCQKMLKKYENKLKNKDLERKVIESLLLKGYNYKSVKAIVEGMIRND